MLVTDNDKILLFSPSEISNIFKSLYGLDYSISGISKTFTALDAGIKIGKTSYIAEEFIQYLFFKKLQDISITKEKIAKRKEEILEGISPELLESVFMMNKSRTKEKYKNKTEEKSKKIEKKLIEIELLKRIKEKKCLFCKLHKVDSQVSLIKKIKNIKHIEYIMDNLIK
ncbi:hypothetical protein F0310_04485 (plasmid) [Borrelia sp. A-FGy1]|uniref:hypothetical protein n=1 Tax=Borrelia sp. A-FGy1 TaxID=2608247 RepID=UPI0015F3FDEE|nr:hypothetical protein [Borrelia sp. A-FGy1]QMU99675.1 hypothetical protein F0310_04485 [Borrelia sp. A-FGy1]